MAKRKKKRFQRDYQYNAEPKNKKLKQVTGYRLLKPPNRRKIYTDVQDARRFSPENAFPYRRIDGTEAAMRTSITDKSDRRYVALAHTKVVYEEPRKTVVCRRRYDRRVELFRSGKIGKGRSTKRFKDRIMKEESKVRC